MILGLTRRQWILLLLITFLVFGAIMHALEVIDDISGQYINARDYSKEKITIDEHGMTFEGFPDDFRVELGDGWGESDRGSTMTWLMRYEHGGVVYDEVLMKANQEPVKIIRPDGWIVVTEDGTVTCSGYFRCGNEEDR